jgi:hypothetical protein
MIPITRLETARQIKINKRGVKASASMSKPATIYQIEVESII